MASIPALALLLIFQSAMADDFHHLLSPLLSPIFGNMTHSCSSAPPPDIQTKPRTNESIFDPCHWMDCGGGSCNKTSALTYKCDCLEGYYNLLNFNAFPCFKDCSIEKDRKELGLPVMNSSASTTSNSTTNNNAASGLFLERGFLSVISSVVTCVATLLLLLLNK